MLVYHRVTAGSPQKTTHFGKGRSTSKPPWLERFNYCEFSRGATGTSPWPQANRYVVWRVWWKVRRFYSQVSQQVEQQPLITFIIFHYFVQKTVHWPEISLLSTITTAVFIDIQTTIIIFLLLPTTMVVLEHPWKLTAGTHWRPPSLVALQSQHPRHLAEPLMHHLNQQLDRQRNLGDEDVFII